MHLKFSLRLFMTAGWRLETSGEKPLGLRVQCCVSVCLCVWERVNQSTHFGVCVCVLEGIQVYFWLMAVCVCVSLFAPIPAFRALKWRYFWEGEGVLANVPLVVMVQFKVCDCGVLYVATLVCVCTTGAWSFKVIASLAVVVAEILWPKNV